MALVYFIMMPCKCGQLCQEIVKQEMKARNEKNSKEKYFKRMKNPKKKQKTENDNENKNENENEK